VIPLTLFVMDRAQGCEISRSMMFRDETGTGLVFLPVPDATPPNT
jgi:hypothetical protein